MKKRVGVYVMNGVEAIRRNNLGGIDSNIIILDIRGEQNFRLITLCARKCRFCFYLFFKSLFNWF